MASSAEDALKKLKEDPNNLILGGSAYLRLWSKKKINCAIDLTKAGLRYYDVVDDSIRLGATCRYHDFESDPILSKLAYSIFPSAFANIVGIQLRTEVQLGASVCGKFAFSDLLPVLLVLRARLSWLERGEETIDEFLARQADTDLLKEVVLPKISGTEAAFYDSIRYNSGDLPTLNIAGALFSTDDSSIVNGEDKNVAEASHYSLRLAIGAMPARAKRVTKLEEYLSKLPISEWLKDETLAECVKLLAELRFGTDTKATAEYRQAMATVLLKRCLKGLIDIVECKNDIQANGSSNFDAEIVKKVRENFIPSGNMHVDLEHDSMRGLKFNVQGADEADGVDRAANVGINGDEKFYFYLNGKLISDYKDQVEADCSLFEYLRRKKTYSVKSGCGSSCCGLCTVLINGEARLSCTVPALRVHGLEVMTIEGERKEAEAFAALLAAEGADQCGFCSPGFILSVISLKRRFKDLFRCSSADEVEDKDIKKFLSGNLCRCTGYAGQMRAIKNYLNS